jgi:putative phosphoesterase
VRIAVIADTHLPRGGRRLPDDCIERLRAADVILHAGDIVAASALAELRKLGPPVEAVCGNMDEEALRARLPEERTLDLDGVRIGLVHVPGPRQGREERLRARFPGCEAVIYGHTHVPQITRQAGVWILNPGSPTERRSAPVRSMLVLRIADRAVRPSLVEFG